MKMNKKYLGIMILAAVVVAGVTIPNFTKKAPAEALEKTVTAEVRDLKQQLKTDGIVRLSDSYKIFANNSGVVVKKHVAKGDIVKAGQILLQMDTSDLEQQLAQAEYTLSVDQDSLRDAKRNGNSSEQAAYDRSKAAYDRAKSDYETNKDLLNTGAISVTELEQYKSKMETAYSDLISTQDRLKSNNVQDEVHKLNDKIILDQLTIKNIKADIANATIKASQSGTLINFVDENAAMISAGSLVAEIADLSKLEVEANISEYEIGQVKVGQLVEVTTLGSTEKVYTGKVNTIDSTGSVKNDEVLVETVIALDSVDGEIKPNFTVSLVIETASKASALTVPYEALDKNASGEDMVTLLRGTEKTEVPVKRGLETDLYVEVITDQLQAGDVIVIPTENATAKEKETQNGPGAGANDL